MGLIGVCVESLWVLDSKIGTQACAFHSFPTNEPTAQRQASRHCYLDGVDDRGGHAQAEEPLDGARAVHVVFLHEGAAVVLFWGECGFGFS